MPATKHSKESAHPPKTSAQPRKRKAKDYPADAQLKKKMDCKGKAVEDMCGSDDEIHKNQTSEHWIGRTYLITELFVCCPSNWTMQALRKRHKSIEKI